MTYICKPHIAIRTSVYLAMLTAMPRAPVRLEVYRLLCPVRAYGALVLSALCVLVFLMAKEIELALG